MNIYYWQPTEEEFLSEGLVTYGYHENLPTLSADEDGIEVYKISQPNYSKLTRTPESLKKSLEYYKISNAEDLRVLELDMAALEEYKLRITIEFSAHHEKELKEIREATLSNEDLYFELP